MSATAEGPGVGMTVGAMTVGPVVGPPLLTCGGVGGVGVRDVLSRDAGRTGLGVESAPAVDPYIGGRAVPELTPTDDCVVGLGVAGVSVAWFARTGVDVATAALAGSGERVLVGIWTVTRPRTIASIVWFGVG